MVYKLGSSGVTVKAIQSVVGAKADGYFGFYTQQAVIQWQLKHGMISDGIVGPMTWSAMALAPTDGSSDGQENPHKRGSVAWYEFLYKSLRFDHGYEQRILRNSKTLSVGFNRYYALEQQTGVPWTTIAALHMMESACDFSTYLGNGQNLNRRTTIVPIGRGPFLNFESGALDALHLDGLINVKNWTTGLELKFAESFNGMGYFKYHPSEFSPYVWACSSINDGTGKYTSDGHYNAGANANAQVGVATMFKQLEILGDYKPKFLEVD